MDVKYRVIRQHNRSYDEGIRFRCGESVQVGRRDDRWSSWLWCTNDLGLGAWVPEQLLSASESIRTVVTDDYNSIELTVKHGELVMGTKVLAGWVWCKNSRDEEGWVPVENLQPARN